MDMNITRTRLEGCLDARATVTQLHEGLMAQIQARTSDPDPTEIEREQLTGYRVRQEELDTEITELHAVLEREEQSAKTSRLVRAHLAGQVPGVDMDSDGVPKYRTFAAYARDALIVRNTDIQAEVRMRLGEDYVQKAKERLNRTPAHTLSSDVEGLQPEQHIAQILDVIDSTRPVVATARRVNLQRGRITFPKIAQRPTVLYQGTVEKTEGGTAKMVVNMESGTAATFIGGGNLSWQTIEWSDPDALDLWFTLAGEAYARQTEGTACSVLAAAAAAGTIAAPLNGTADTFADWIAAVLAGFGVVYGASGAMADTLYLSPDMFIEAAATVSDSGAMLINAGSLNVSTLSGTLAGLRVVVSRGFAEGTALVGDSRAFIVAENPGAPVQLRAVEPAIGGYEVGVIGAIAAVVFDDERFATIGPT